MEGDRRGDISKTYFGRYNNRLETSGALRRGGGRKFIDNQQVT